MSSGCASPCNAARVHCPTHRYNTELIEKQLGGNGGAEGEQARAGADGSAGRDEEEEDDEDPSIATVATLDEAKGVMRVLFGMVVEAKNTERSKVRVTGVAWGGLCPCAACSRGAGWRWLNRSTRRWRT